MKINDVIRHHRKLAYEYSHSKHEMFSDLAKKEEAMAEALEQHHKDLMVLVKAWRNRLVSDDCMDYKEGFYQAMEDCSSELKSLINPKD